MGQIKEKNIYKQMKKRKQQRDFLGKMFAYFTMSLIGLVMLIPMIWMISTSLKEKGAVFTYPPEWIPRSTLTTIYNGKEYKIMEANINGKKEKFIELKTFIVRKAVRNTVVFKVKKHKYTEVKIEFLTAKKNFPKSLIVDMNDLIPTEEKYDYVDGEKTVYLTKSGIGIDDNEDSYKKCKLDANMKVFIPESEIKKNYKINFTPITIKQDLENLYPDDTKLKKLKLGGMDKPIYKVKINNKIVDVIIQSSPIVKQEIRNAEILLVKPSTKVKAITQEVDEYGELQGFDKTIIYDKKNLVKTKETAESLSGDTYSLYYLNGKEDKKFAITEKSELEYEPTEKNLNNVSKYKIVIDKKNKIEKKVSVFKDVTKIQLLWSNYYKVLFTALPAIKSENLKGVSILTLLLSIFGEIPAFIVYFINSIVISFSVVFLTLFTSLLAAYAFARLEWAGRDKIFLLYLSTMMIPGQVTTIPVFILVKKLGWIDTYKVLILPAAFMTWGVFMLRQFFLSIPVDLEEAAIIDGSTKA